MQVEYSAIFTIPFLLQAGHRIALFSMVAPVHTYLLRLDYLAARPVYSIDSNVNARIVGDDLAT